jgi:hypothetical protein
MIQLPTKPTERAECIHVIERGRKCIAAPNRATAVVEGTFTKPYRQGWCSSLSLSDIRLQSEERIVGTP